MTNRLLAAWVALRARTEAGMSTAEYAVGTIAAVAFAGALIAVVKSPAVRAALASIIANALGTGG
jgi:thiol:disulfide interchange protein